MPWPLQLFNAAQLPHTKLQVHNKKTASRSAMATLLSRCLYDIIYNERRIEMTAQQLAKGFPRTKRFKATSAREQGNRRFGSALSAKNRAFDNHTQYPTQ
jgi:hypothetical protein